MLGRSVCRRTPEASGDASRRRPQSLSRARGAALLAAAMLSVLWAAAPAGAHVARAAGMSLRANPLVQLDEPPKAPHVEAEQASEVSRTSAILNAVVNPEGAEVTECYFDYGTSPALGTHAQCTNLPGSGTSGIPVYASVTGLKESTTYYYKIVAANDVGEKASEDTERFLTLPRAPHVSTEGAREVGKTTADLIGIVNPNGAEVTECYFEYGTTKQVEETVNCSALPGSGEKPVPVSAQLEGLKESETYFVRLVAVNADGVSVSGREEFQTLPDAPRAKTEPARDVATTTALLRGIINPHGEAVTSCYFEYGHEKRIYGETVNCKQSVGSGEEPVEVTAEATGLEKSSTYNFVLVAKNGKGEALGGNQTFRTLPNAPRDNTNNATELTGESALLHASVNPEGAEVTTCEFEYGTTFALGTKVPCASKPGNGVVAVPVSASVSGLKATQKYYFRIHAENTFGGAFGGISKFTTLEAGLPPTVIKLSPSKGVEAGGTTVKIKGTNFSHVLEVKFGATEATSFEVRKVTQIVAKAPPGTSGTVEVTVTTGSGTSAPSAGDKYTYK